MVQAFMNRWKRIFMEETLLLSRRLIGGRVQNRYPTGPIGME